MTVRRAVLAADIGNDAVRLLRRDRVMHMRAARGRPRLEGFEIKIEEAQRVVLDVARGVAQRIELRQHVGDIAPALGEVRLDEVERVLQLGIDERRLGVLFEARRGGVMGHRLASGLAGCACVSPGAPIGG